MPKLNKLLAELLKEQLRFKRTMVDPFYLISQIMNNYNIAIEIDDIPGVYITIEGEKVENPFFVEWFNRLVLKHYGHFTYSEMSHDDYFDGVNDYKNYILFIWDLFNCYGSHYGYYFQKYNFGKKINEVPESTLFSDEVTVNQSANSTTETLPTYGAVEDSPETLGKNDTESTQTSRNNYIYKLNYVLNTLPNFWEEFLEEFNYFFTSNDLDYNK